MCTHAQQGRASCLRELSVLLLASLFVGAHPTQADASAKNSQILRSAIITPIPRVEPMPNQPHCAAKHRLSCTKTPTEHAGLPFASWLGATTWMNFKAKVCSVHPSTLCTTRLHAMTCIHPRRCPSFYLILQLQRLSHCLFWVLHLRGLHNHRRCYERQDARHRRPCRI